MIKEKAFILIEELLNQIFGLKPQAVAVLKNGKQVVVPVKR